MAFGSSNGTNLMGRGSSGSGFSDSSPQVADNTAESGSVFSGLAEGFKSVAGIVGEALPVWAEYELRQQEFDQLRQPTYDQRYADSRVTDADYQTTAGTVGGPQTIIPGISNGALIFGTVVLITVGLVAWSR